MSNRSYISSFLRQLVSNRANYLCEYCLIHQDDTYLGCEIDHIISLKHGGLNTEDNLAYSCTFCNRAKGSDIGSIILQTNQFVRFFNPHLDRWSTHFVFDGIIIKPLTDIGYVTSQILQFNILDRLLEKQMLERIGRYPSDIALNHIRNF